MFAYNVGKRNSEAEILFLLYQIFVIVLKCQSSSIMHILIYLSDTVVLINHSPSPNAAVYHHYV